MPFEPRASFLDGCKQTTADWTSSRKQQAIAQRRGTVHSYILFTGYLPARMRGEMQSYQVLGAP